MSFLEVMRGILQQEGLTPVQGGQELGKSSQSGNQSGGVLIEPALTAPRASPDWNAEYRTLAAVTHNITKEDPRFSLIMAALDRCDVAFAQGNWGQFQGFAEEVRRAVKVSE